MTGEPLASGPLRAAYFNGEETQDELDRRGAAIKAEYDNQLEILKAKLKSESDVEVERLRSQLSIAAAERQFRFSKLHEKRADAIAEVYALLKPFVSALADYVKVVESADGPSREDRNKRVIETGNAFLLYFLKKDFHPRFGSKKN
jgi:LPS O-antigen subunit length determinant protein (WzzB/FepE family)